MKTLSLVISCYNEEAVLERFYEATAPVLESCGWAWELIFVDDGSTDGSPALLEALAAREPRVKALRLSRNYGHEAAMIAGIDHARGDGVICMDADLQHPPRCLPQILERLEAGYDVVSLVRRKNPGAGPLKGLCSRLFYRLLNRLSGQRFREAASDFFGLSARAAAVLRKEYRERVRYLRGYVQSIGYRCCSLPYDADPRAGGESHYSLRALLSFSLTSLLSYSALPLKLGIYSGLLAALCGLILLFYSLAVKARRGAPDGYTTIIVALCFFFAVTLFLIGIIGEYIAILLQEVKARPIYLIDRKINMKDREDG